MDRNADRRCEACYADWRGGPECPVCGHINAPDPLFTICAWCPDTFLVTRMAVASGHDVTHGLCDDCRGRF